MQAWVDAEASLERLLVILLAWYSLVPNPGFQDQFDTRSSRSTYTLVVLYNYQYGRAWRDIQCCIKNLGPLKRGVLAAHGMISRTNPHTSPRPTQSSNLNPGTIPYGASYISTRAISSFAWNYLGIMNLSKWALAPDRISIVYKIAGNQHPEPCTMDPGAWEAICLATDRFSSWGWPSLKEVWTHERRAMSLQRRFVSQVR